MVRMRVLWLRDVGDVWIVRDIGCWSEVWSLACIQLMWEGDRNTGRGLRQVGVRT